MGLRAASLFILWLALSYAHEIRKGRRRNHGHYVCSTWGNDHFKTFDGDIYQFPGICEYNFVSDCSDSYAEFSVHIQRALNSNNHPEIQYILLKIKDVTVYLKPKLVVVDGRIVKTPYYSSGLLIESNDIYTKIYAKLGMVLMWNQQDALMVELDNKFNNRTCGLCGDYNGIPIYNEFIKGDASYNSITYGNLQKISKPNAKCEDPDETQALPSCNKHRDECERLLTSSAFADCRFRLNLETYIQACMQDKCACNGNEDSFCICSTISEYSRQCSHAGGRPGEWRTQNFCPKTCPDTMVYRESSSPCTDTCSHLDISSLCEEHYMDGCFCPEGTVYDDITGKGCVPVSQCHCKLLGKQYAPGESISNECEECTCNSGRWTCKDLPCPGTCSVEGGSHISTFDGKKYTFHGDCYYVLAKGTANDSYALLAELAPCGSTDRQTCLKTVVLLADHKKNVVVFRSDGSVLLNEMTVNVPHVSASFSVFKPSSNYLVVQTSFALQVQIQLLPVMQLFVTVDQSVQGEIQGLCGNFNGMEGDDFKTTSGLVEATGSAFANTWKAQSICTDRVEKLEDPCSLSIESANYAEHWCSLLKNPEGPFARCHLVIDPSEYYKKCKYDTCLCEDNEECLCAALSSYSRACAFKGIILGGWRDSVCSNEVSACPGNQVFLYNITRCQQTCRSLADGEKYCLQDYAPVDGCGCSPNTYLDKQDNCVPISECPCYYKGSYLEPGEYFTKDGERCVCRNAKVQCTSVKLRMKSAEQCSSNKTFFDCNASSKWTSQTPVQLSCHTPLTNHFQTECVSGCVCPEGLFDDGRGGCVEEKDCPCIHNNEWYSSGQKITVDCNTCTCQKGVWSCTANECYGTCMIYGSGHYITFDGKFYDFDGNCEYVAIQDFCGDKNSSGSFSIITENVPCGTTGVTCSKAIKMFLGKTELKLENKEYKEIQRDVGDDVLYWNRTVGLYLVIEASNGVMLIWDKKTTVFVKLSPDYKGKVCGLCGNFDDKSNNDFVTRSGLQETNALKFGNSWKQSPMCPDVTQEIKPCDMKPHRKSWAEKECSIILSEVFKICHSKVDPVPFYDACVHDACSCDSGGDCECFCSAVAAYAQECTKVEACVFWRTPDICPIFCDYYNPRDECEWHYEPCGSNITTCRMINNVSTNFTVPYLEGCYPRCPKDKPIYNEETKECVPEDQCWCYIDGIQVPPGHEIPTKENCTICVCGPSGSIQCKPVPGCPCVINGTSYEVGQTVAQVQDGDICITYICAENGSVVPDKIYPCPTSSSPTVLSTSFPTSTLTTTVTTTSHPVTTTPCFGLICDWTEWFDVSNPEKDGGDYETYDEIRKHGYKICEAPEKIECRAEDKPDVSLEELGQKVQCNVSYGLICKNEEQDVTMWQLCYNYEIRVNCCEWQEIPCEVTPTPSTPRTTTSTTTKTSVPLTTTSRIPTEIITSTTHIASTTSELTPSVSTPVTSTPPELLHQADIAPQGNAMITRKEHIPGTTMPPISTTSSSTPGTTTVVTGSPTPTSSPINIVTQTPQPPTTLPLKGSTPGSETPTKTSTPVTPSATPLPTTRTTETGSTVFTRSTTIQQSTSSVSTSPVTVTTSEVTETGSTPKTTTSGPTPSRSTSTTPVTETSSHETTTTGTTSPPTGSHTTPVSTTTSGPSSLGSTPSSTVSLSSASTSSVPVTTSGTTPTKTFTTTSGTTSSSFTISTATTTSTTLETLSPSSASTSGPTATSTAVTTTGSSTYSTITPVSGSSSTTGLTPTTPKKICSILPNESYEQGESWWLCNCTKAICIEDDIVQVIPIICNPPPKPTCANGLSPVPVIDEDGCCWHWECDCYCTGWGDPHYMTFDGLYYSYQGNCTYVLVEEINKKVDNFGVYIDNYHCDSRDVVSCPRTLIVRHETQEVRMTTVTPNTLQVEVTVNNNLVALPYKKFGVSIYESGINRVVEIPELKMNVTYNGLSFSIRMPYSLFGNNTQGQCGTCNNNTADDCMLPNGNIAENCETMADHWQVVDPSKPQCSPGLNPTSSPSTTPAEPCKESSICELLLGSVFKPCHEFVRPEKYYTACVFDSCVLPNLDLECSSLQIYAATCADQGVCIDWRSHTNGVCCKYECPSGKEFRACGPIKEPTCKSSHQNETSTKQVEGCFCPNGTMLYDSGMDVCVKTCGCVGVDMIPREFGEKFIVDCQDCICLEGEHGIVCQPHECAEQHVTCNGEGFYQVTEVNPEDSCCPLVTCKCNTSLCTAKAPKCTLGFEVHSYIPSGQCCPVYQCVPKGVCVHQSAEFLPNSSVFVDKCQNCLCTNEVNVSTQLNIISCEPVPCNTYCAPGYELKPVKGECCGRCVQTKCIIHVANSGELILSPGEFKNDPNNNCTIYSCVDFHNQLISSTSEITCPAFNEDSCKPGTISFLPNGCCKTCAPVDSSTPCSVREREDFIVYNGCRSVDRVVMTECEGTCGTVSLYSAEANSMDHSCSCCRETRTTEKHVVLKCPGGHSISHKYIYVESCSCQDTECKNPQSSQLQTRK
ncbi:mucin-2 [Neopelma chrysocephalum]|uniref:mucin-2 n=1 Tax=Neopelma chrysocephalum TaxID=114329 RepID=UPI000FCD1CED|nr:mucin-2 [Neopelma chrysocephalum]